MPYLACAYSGAQSKKNICFQVPISQSAIEPDRCSFFEFFFLFIFNMPINFMERKKRNFERNGNSTVTQEKTRRRNERGSQSVVSVVDVVVFAWEFNIASTEVHWRPLSSCNWEKAKRNETKKKILGIFSQPPLPPVVPAFIVINQIQLSAEIRHLQPPFSFARMTWPHHNFETIEEQLIT